MENNAPEISFYVRLLNLTERETVTVSKNIENYEKRDKSDGSYNLSINLCSRDVAQSLIGILNNYPNIYKKSDLFVTLLPICDTGIKTIPDFVVDYIRHINREISISYTFLT
jgi:hypothetical protein